MKLFQNCINCLPGSLDNKLVKGKIVLCEGNIGAVKAFRAGAVGALIQGHKFVDIACISYLRSKDAADIHKVD